MRHLRWRPTLGHRAGLPSDGAGGPDLPQSVAKDCGEVVGVCGLVPPCGKALLLHALQGAVGRRDGLAVQGPRGAVLAVLGDVDDLAIGVESLPVDLYAVLTNLVPCRIAGTKSAMQRHSAKCPGRQPVCAGPSLLPPFCTAAVCFAQAMARQAGLSADQLSSLPHKENPEGYNQ